MTIWIFFKRGTMELLIVALAAFLIFRTEIKKTINENWEDISANAVPLTKYLGSSILLTFTVSIFPNLIMVLYMRAEGFFAYELFSGNTHAFGVLSGNIFINYLLLSFGFYGSSILVAKKAGKVAIIGFGLLNAAVLGYFILLASNSAHWIILATMLFATFLIAAYAYFMLSSGIKGRARAWYAPLILTGILVIAPIMFSQYTARFARVSLAQMKVGGINVKLTKAEDFLKLEGERHYKAMWLVLRTPELLYLKDSEDAKSILILKASDYLLATEIPGSHD
jgi:hypothetical protein